MDLTITHKHLKNQLDLLETTENLELVVKELEFSTLLLPVNIENDTFSFPTVNIADMNFIPVFTDIYEYDKVKFPGDFTLLPHSFDFYLSILDEGLDGIIIDVEGMKFPITPNFKHLFTNNEIFNQETCFHTLEEVRKVRSSVDNSDLDEFLHNESDFWDFERLLNILEKSYVFCVGLSFDDLTKDSKDGIIHVDGVLPKALYNNANQNYALLYSSEDEIKPKNNPLIPYPQLVNFALFARQTLLDDLDGIILNENSQNITIPREVLLDYIDCIESFDLNRYDDYAFELNS